MKPGFYGNVSPADYFGDRLGDVPRLSASMATVLDQRSPQHAYARHPRLGGNAPQEHSEAFDLGNTSHKLLLGAGKRIEIVDADDWRTKAAKEARAAARAAGATALLRKHHDAAVEVADTLKQRFADFGIVLDGQSEVAMLWNERADNGNEVPCKSLVDHMKGSDFYDLKSCASASMEAIQRSADAYGYAIQRAAYVAGGGALMAEMLGRIRFVFVFYELVPPFVVHPVVLSGEFASLGARKWRRAVNTWERCMREDSWPGYATPGAPFGVVEAPGWADARDQERHGFDSMMKEEA